MPELIMPWSISHFVTTLCPPDFKGARLLTIFSTFCDESEVAADDPRVRVFSMAAALAEPDGWLRFKEPWTAVLAKYGVEYFRASQLEAGRGPYEGWPKKKRIAFHSEMIDAHRVAETMWFSCTVVLKDYEALPEDVRSKLGTPYELCAISCVRNVSYFLGNPPWVHLDGLVHYVFEQQEKGTGRLSELFDLTLRTCPERRLAGRPLWARKEDFVELQVADLYAYEVGKDALREMGADRRETRKSMLAIDKSTPRRHYLLDAKNLEDLAKWEWGNLATGDFEAYLARRGGV